MSNCLVLQGKNFIAIGADTASSVLIDKKYKRFGTNAKKLYRFGNEVMFCSGKMKLVELITSNVIIKNNRISLNNLTAFIKSINIQESNTYNIEILICGVENGKSYIHQISQYNDFRVKTITNNTNGCAIYSTGFNAKTMLDVAKKNYSLCQNISNLFIKSFTDISSDEVGGYINMYLIQGNQITKCVDNHKVDDIKPISATKNDIHYVVADCLIGDLIAGETLLISNTHQTFIVDKDGIIVNNMKLDMYSEDQKHRILIDPALKSMFNIYNENEQVFFIDQNGNVSMYGNLYVNNGNAYLKANLDDDNILEIGINAKKQINDRITKLKDTSWTNASFIKYNDNIYATVVDSGNYYHCKYVYDEKNDKFIENTNTKIINLFNKYSGIIFNIDDTTFINSDVNGKISIIKFIDGIENESLLIKEINKNFIRCIGNDTKYLYFVSYQYADDEQPWLGSTAVIVRTEIHNSDELYDSIVIDGYEYSDSIYDCEILNECVYITVKDSNSVGYITKVSFLNMAFTILCEIPDSEGYGGNVEDCYILVHNGYMNLIGNHTYGVAGNEKLNYIYIANNNLAILNDLPVGIGNRYRYNNCFWFNDKIHLFSQVYGDNSYDNEVLHYTLKIISEDRKEQKVFYVTNKGNGYFDGNIIARSLTLGSDVSIDMSHVDGLDGALEGINHDLSNVIYKGDIQISTETTDDGTVKTTTKVPDGSGGYTENTTYTSADGSYVYTNVGIGGNDSGHFVKISKDGLLEAQNAIIQGTVYATKGAFGGWVIGEDSIFSINFDTSNSGIKMLSNGKILSKGTGYSEQMYARLDSGKWIFGLGDTFDTEDKRYSDLSADGLYLCSKDSIINEKSQYLFSVDTVNDAIKVTSSSDNPALEVINNSDGTCLKVVNESCTYDNKCLSLAVKSLDADGSETTGYITLFGEGEGGTGRVILRPDQNIKSADTEHPANFTNSACGTFYYPWGTMSCEQLYVDKVAVTSDAKVKTPIKLIDRKTALEFVNSLIPREYHYKKSNNKRVHMGFYAQEVNQTVKEMNLGDMAIYEAILSKDGDEIEYQFNDGADDEHLHWILNYNEFIAPIVASIQELTRRDEEKEKKIEELSDTVNLLLDEVKQLKNELKEMKETK